MGLTPGETLWDVKDANVALHVEPPDFPWGSELRTP